MTEKKSKGGSSKPTTTRSAGISPEMLSQSGISGSLSSSAPNLPMAALFGQTLAADSNVADDMARQAPTFGAVLRSIGMGVAASQTALDQGLVSTAQTLSNTKIDLVTQVVQQLNDDGLPDTNQTELKTKRVSLINYINPQAHEWKHVALSMDLKVGEMSRESGFTFNRRQSSSSVATTGLFWGFVGWFDHSTRDSYQSYSSESERETAWAEGQVRMDAMLAPRRTDKFPVPAEVTIGPQLAFAQGAVGEVTAGNVVTERNMQLTITLRKADGSVNPGKTIEVTSDRFATEYADNGNPGNFNVTNADGMVKVMVRRPILNPLFAGRVKGAVTAKLGDMTRATEVNL